MFTGDWTGSRSCPSQTGETGEFSRPPFGPSPFLPPCQALPRNGSNGGDDSRTRLTSASSRPLPLGRQTSTTPAGRPEGLGPRPEVAPPPSTVRSGEGPTGRRCPPCRVGGLGSGGLRVGPGTSTESVEGRPLPARPPVPSLSSTLSTPPPSSSVTHVLKDRLDGGGGRSSSVPVVVKLPVNRPCPRRP